MRYPPRSRAFIMMTRACVSAIVAALVVQGGCEKAPAPVSATPKPTAPAPTPPTSPAAEPAKPSPVPSKPTSDQPAAKVDYPPTPQKKLFATQDVRGKPAPNLEIESWLTPKPETKGKVVLVDFWATWCPPCRALIPELNEWQKEFKDDLVIIGVSDETETKVKAFMTNTSVQYTMAIDTKARTKNALGVQGIPHALVISSDNVVRWQGFPQGEDKLTKEKLKQIIEADKARRN